MIKTYRIIFCRAPRAPDGRGGARYSDSINDMPYNVFISNEVMNLPEDRRRSFTETARLLVETLKGETLELRVTNQDI